MSRFSKFSPLGFLKNLWILSLHVRVSFVTVVLTCSVILYGEIHVVSWETAWRVQSRRKDPVCDDLNHVTSFCICERKLQTFVQLLFNKMSRV